MTRGLWCVLLLSTGVALAGDPPEPKRPAGATATPAKPAEAPKPAEASKPGESPKPADATKPAEATKPPEPTKPADPKSKEAPDLGMSILGNQEAPKALVIVPWKTSEMGDAHGISTMLDDSRLPIDKEVFMRLLGYYEIRSGTTLHDGGPAAPTATPTATPRRKS